MTSNILIELFDRPEQDILESRLIPTEQFYKRFTYKQFLEVTFLYFVTLELLCNEPYTEDWARSYFLRTFKYRNFSSFRYDSTDLYALLYGLQNEEVHSRFIGGNQTDFVKARTNVTDQTIYMATQYISKRARGISNYSERNRFFLKFERDLFISDSSLKALRRLALDWHRLNFSQKRITITRLLQAWRARAFRSEVLPILHDFAEQQKLEMKNVRNPEKPTEMGMGKIRNSPKTIHGGEYGSQKVAKKKSGKFDFLKSLAIGSAALGGGIATGYGLKKAGVFEYEDRGEKNETK